MECPASAAMTSSVEVGEPDASCVQAIEENGREALHQLVAERWILVALLAYADAVDGDGADRSDRARVEVPGVGREESRPAHDLARVHRLDRHRTAPRHVELMPLVQRTGQQHEN